MEDDIRTAITDIRAPSLSRSNSKTSINDTRSAKSAFIWMIRRCVVLCLLVIELNRIAGKFLTEYLIDAGYFGEEISEEVKENETEKPDLDDTLPVLLVQLVLQLTLPAIFVPHIVAYFLPKLVVGVSHDRDL